MKHLAIHTEPGQPLGHCTVEHPRALAASQHQNSERTRPGGESSLRRLNSQKLPANRITGPGAGSARRQGPGEGQQDSPCKPRQQAIGIAGNRILFVN